MKIGSRNFLMLQEVIENEAHITGKDLENKFHLSRKQVSYGIKKINEYMKECGYPEIIRLSNGRFNVPERVINELDLIKIEQENQEIWFSKEERMDIICLMLLASQEELSLWHFVTILKVSKNTVLTDLKKLEDVLRKRELTIAYERKTGYVINGTEYEKRQLLLTILSDVMIQYGHYFVVKEICHMQTEGLKKIQEMLIGIEEQLNVKFAGEMIEINSYLFYIIFSRIKNGMVLNEIPDNFKHIIGTAEYAVIKTFAERNEIKNTYEIMYLTAHIQSMKLDAFLWGKVGLEKSSIKKAVEDTIENYEKLACVNIQDKEELKNMLIHHCEPALYRIRYNFHVGLDITEYILPAYQELHNVVSKAVSPLENLVEKKIPEKELVYISLIIGTHITKEGYEKEENIHPKAVVVCQNGITVSRFLWSSLKDVFPEIQFTKCMSVNEFKQYKESFDIVFSTTTLKTDKRLFVINPLMDDKKRKKIREQVLKSFENDGFFLSQQNEIMQIVKRHMSASSYKKLCSEIDAHVLKEEQKEIWDDKKEYHLLELLDKNTIRVVDESMGWKVAIEFAAMPLLYDNIINRQYVEKIIYNIMEHRPYLEVADGVIIAHAGIEDGVNDVGMSMLVLPEKISILGYLNANVIVVLATPDYESHLLALNELIDILEDEEKLSHIKHATVENDILKLL